MTGRSSRFPFVLALVAATFAAAGAVMFAVLAARPEKTVVRRVTVAGSPVSATTRSLSVGRIYKRTYRGVVQIIVRTAAQTPFGVDASEAEGSGFVVSADGEIVTNEHVVDGATSITVKFWNGRTSTAQVVDSDPSLDLAVVKVNAPSSQLPPLALGDSSDVQVGDTVVAIGSPFGLQGTVTSGIVSALHRRISGTNNATINNAIQTDAAINHGNSGGPLLNARGRVIGVNSQIESGSGGSDGVGFAVPSSAVKQLLSRV